MLQCLVGDCQDNAWKRWSAAPFSARRHTSGSTVAGSTALPWRSEVEVGCPPVQVLRLVAHQVLQPDRQPEPGLSLRLAARDPIGVAVALPRAFGAGRLYLELESGFRGRAARGGQRLHHYRAGSMLGTEILGMTEATAKHHVANILTKLQAGSGANSILIAERCLS